MMSNPAANTKKNVPQKYSNKFKRYYDTHYDNIQHKQLQKNKFLLIEKTINKLQQIL